MIRVDLEATCIKIPNTSPSTNTRIRQRESCSGEEELLSF